jgi:hemerythrin
MNDFTAPPFVWRDDFLLGYTPMDEVHEEFVTLVVAVVDCPDQTIAATLDALLEHARRHFGDEDRWMGESNFPARDCHTAEHAAVLRSIEGVCHRVAQGDCAAGRTLARALVDWFPGHADYLDSALAHWMCKQRLGGKPVVLRRRIETIAEATD